MKYSKAATIQKTHHLPTLKFEDQQLTSFAGLLVFHRPTSCINSGCFSSESRVVVGFMT